MLLIALLGEMRNPTLYLHVSRFVGWAVDERSHEHPEGSSAFRDGRFILSDAFINVCLHHFEEFMIAFVDQIHVWWFDLLDGDPSLERNANHDAPAEFFGVRALSLEDFKLGVFQLEVNVLIVEAFLVEVKVFAVGEG